MQKKHIHTDSAPAAIGTYSQAVKAGNIVYLSGQIPLLPASMTIVSDDMSEQTHQVFKNLSAVAKAAHGSLEDVVKLSIYMTDLGNFAIVNEVMAHYFNEPYPARATVGVSSLPKNAQLEVEAVMILDNQF